MRTSGVNGFFGTMSRSLDASLGVIDSRENTRGKRNDGSKAGTDHSNKHHHLFIFTFTFRTRIKCKFVCIALDCDYRRLV